MEFGCWDGLRKDRKEGGWMTFKDINFFNYLNIS